MIGVILAAGMARRLRPLTDRCPKCLLKVRNRSLLQRTVGAMIEAGVDRLVVVTGYKGDMIVDELDRLFPQLDKTYIDNADYENNNNIFSLWLTRQFIDGRPFLLADSDILLDPALIKRVVEAGSPSIALNRHDLGDEEMKIIVDQAMNVMRITKECDPDKAIGESVGIEYISADYSSALFAELEQMIEHEGLKDKFYELAFERIIPAGHTFRAVDTTDLFSMELDTPQDFEQATSVVPSHLL